MPRPHAFTEDGAKRIVRAVRAVESGLEQRPLSNLARRAVRPRSRFLLEGCMDADLTAPPDKDNPTTATMSVFRYPTVGGALVDTGENITVHNRDPNIVITSGSFTVVERIGEEWRPLAGGPIGGGNPIGPVQRENTPGQVAAVLGANVVLVVVDTNATGTSVTVTLPASSDGHTAWIKNTGDFFFRSVTVSTVQFTETSSAAVVLGPGNSQGVIYEAATGFWWGID